MAGLAHLQTARLNVVAVGGGTPDPSQQVCRVGLGFRDASGRLFRDASGMDIAAEFTLAPGRAVHLALREADAFRGRTGRRVAVRADALWLDPPTAESLRPIVATLEIVMTGQTVLLYWPRLNVVAVGGSPDPQGCHSLRHGGSQTADRPAERRGGGGGSWTRAICRFAPSRSDSSTRWAIRSAIPAACRSPQPACSHRPGGVLDLRAPTRRDTTVARGLPPGGPGAVDGTDEPCHGPCHLDRSTP
jgi:hypothetical protein